MTLTQDQKKEVAALLTQGWSVQRINNSLNIPSGAIQAFIDNSYISSDI